MKVGDDAIFQERALRRNCIEDVHELYVPTSYAVDQLAKLIASFPGVIMWGSWRFFAPFLSELGGEIGKTVRMASVRSWWL